MMRCSAVLVVTLLQLTVPPAQAAVYRCGHAPVSYSQWPCSDGKAIDVDDPRPLSAIREAQAIADRQSRLAEQLQQQRLRDEAESARRSLAGIAHPPAPRVSAVACLTAAKGPKPRKRSADRAPGAKPSSVRTWPSARRGSPRATGSPECS